MVNTETRNEALPRVSRPISIYAIEMALEEINTRYKYVTCIFLLCSIAGVFNAWHILVSNFYAPLPTYWCRVPELEAAGWTPDQIRGISTFNNSVSSCSYIGWNYTLFAELGYKASLHHISNSTSIPEKISCKEFFYKEGDASTNVVIEWDLVCDKKVYKSHVQGSIALGKFIGGFIFGFIADKYGRKPAFLVCCVLYLISGVGSTVTDFLWVFLITRFFSGVAGVGCYEGGFTLLEELVSKKHRAALGCMYNLGYPIGHMTLPGLSWMLPNWRYLQLSISLPLIIMGLHFWLLPESPRWLYVHGQPEKAWKIIKKFNKNIDNLTDNEEGAVRQTNKEDVGHPGTSGQVERVVEPRVSQSEPEKKISIQSETNISITDRLSKDVRDIFLLFSTCELRKRVSISIFNFFTASLIYYVIAFNAVNFELNQDFYTFMSGVVAFPGYIFPLLIMKCMGRKWTSTWLFLLSGLPLIVVLFISKDYKTSILTLVMFGRFTNVAVFGLVTVYCAELFPTIVRNSAVGVSLAMSQLGSIFAQYIVDYLGPYGWYIPSTICGFFAVAAALLILLLPETKGKPLLNTVDDVKAQSDKVSCRNCCKFS